MNVLASSILRMDANWVDYLLIALYFVFVLGIGLSARVNPHSPKEARINGVVVNLPAFAAAFSCKPGQPMVKEPEKVCRIW